MNVCEYCGADFPNITELYKHKYRSHQRQSIALHNHINPKDSMDIVPYQPKKQMVTSPYEAELEPEIRVGEKRKRDEIDSHNPKRYRDSAETSRAIIPASRKVTRKFDQVGTPVILPAKPDIEIAETPKKLVLPEPTAIELPSIEPRIPGNQIIAADKGIGTLKKSINYKEYYEKCLAELIAKEENFKQQISKVRKECGDDITKIKKRFKKREVTLKKELSSQKNFNDKKAKEIDLFHEKNIAMLKAKIKSMEEGKGSLKPLSDAIFNCVTMEEIFKIKSLLKQHDIDQIIEDHLETIQKLFLSLSYGVIPICQPQRDIISQFQKELIEQIETS